MGEEIKLGDRTSKHADEHMAWVHTEIFTDLNRYMPVENAKNFLEALKHGEISNVIIDY